MGEKFTPTMTPGRKGEVPSEQSPAAVRGASLFFLSLSLLPALLICSPRPNSTSRRKRDTPRARWSVRLLAARVYVYAARECKTLHNAAGENNRDSGAN